MKTKKRFTEVCILDTCLPDYFSGYCYPVIAVPMFHNMCKDEFAEELKNQVNYDYEHLNSVFTEEEIKLFNDYAEKLLKENNEVIYTDFDESDDFCESVYTYVSLCKPVFKYGMQFLNE